MDIIEKNHSELKEDFKLNSSHYKVLMEIFENVSLICRNLLNSYIYKSPNEKDRKIKTIKNIGNEVCFNTKKWCIEIIWELETHKGLNFNELKRNIKGISSRSLSDRLKELQKHGLISRTVKNTQPPTVYYQLNEKGNRIVELMTLILVYLKLF